MRFGIDTSIWQGVMNWAFAKSRGIDFAVIRAGSINNITGVMYDDYQLLNNIANCMLPRTFYWFFRPNWDPIMQAQFFWALVKDVRREFPLVADVETYAGLNQTDFRLKVRQFLNELERLDGVKPIIYTRATIWNPFIGNVAWAKEYILWAARYVAIDTNHRPVLTGPWSDGKYKPLGWDNWGMWQFSADGNGLGAYYGADSNAIDLNLMQDAVYDAFVSPPPPPPPPPDPTRTTVYVPAEADVIEVVRTST